MESAGDREPGGQDDIADRGPAETPVRVAFFSHETSNLKATELWCDLPAAEGARFGIEGESFTAPLPILVDRIWRLWSTTRYLGRFLWGLYWVLVFLPVRIAQLARLGRFDVVFVQRTMFRIKSPPILEWVTTRILRKPIVLHLDDPLWIRFPRRRVIQRCQMAEFVVTGSDVTADFIESVGGTVRKVEYGLDPNRYEKKEHEGSNGLVVGFTGTGGDVYIDRIADSIARACLETGSRFAYRGGPAKPEIPGLDPVMDWSPWDEEDPTGFLSDFDVAICPLIDDEWTRGKETFKVKEYMAAGLPQVLSPVGYGLQVVEEGVEGFFADTEDEWFDRLMILLRDPDLRTEMGTAARLKIETDYRSDAMLAGIAEVCREVEKGRSGD